MLYENTGTDVAPVWSPFAHATSHSRSGTTNMRERAHKDDGGATGVKPGRHTPGTINISGLKSYDGKDYDDLEEKRLNRTRIQYKYSGRPTGDTDAIDTVEDTGDTYWEGYCYVSECSTEDPVDGDSTYSATLTQDGVATKKTVS